MIEMIIDKGDKDVLLFTDESFTARLIRKGLNIIGATYFGKGGGFSCRVPRQTATKFLRSKKIKFATLVSP